MKSSSKRGRGRRSSKQVAVVEDEEDEMVCDPSMRAHACVQNMRFTPETLLVHTAVGECANVFILGTGWRYLCSGSCVLLALRSRGLSVIVAYLCDHRRTILRRRTTISCLHSS